MSEKRHKINKFGNYQNIIVRNSDRHGFVPSQNGRPLVLTSCAWSEAKPLTRPLMITLQVVRTSFEFHLRECMGSSFPPPDPSHMDKIPVPPIEEPWNSSGACYNNWRFFRGRVKKYSFFQGGALICMKFSRGTPIFLYSSGHIWWKSSGVKAILFNLQG